MTTLASLQLHTPVRFRGRLTVHGTPGLGLARRQLAAPARAVESMRDYQPGDPLAAVDWRAYGRSDRLRIRTVRESTPLQWGIALDCGESMGAGPGPGAAQAKGTLAGRLALHLAHQLLRRGERVLLAAPCLERSGEPHPPRWVAVGRRTVAAASRQVEDVAAWAELVAAHPPARTPPGRVVWLSDGLAYPWLEGRVTAAELAAAWRLQVWIQVLADAEVDWGNYPPDLPLSPDPGGEPVALPAATTRLSRWLEEQRHASQAAGVAHHLAWPGAALDGYLAFLAQVCYDG